MNCDAYLKNLIACMGLTLAVSLNAMFSLQDGANEVVNKYYTTEDLSQEASAIDYQLVLAAIHDNLPKVDELLSQGANPKIIDGTRGTLLHRLAVLGNEKCLARFIAAGVNLDAWNMFRYTAMHLAAIHGKSGCLEQLIKAGAKVDARLFEQRRTPLIEAAENGHLECIKLLLAANANVKAEGQWGECALHLSLAKGHKSCAELLVKHYIAKQITIRAEFLHRLEEAGLIILNGADYSYKLVV